LSVFVVIVIVIVVSVSSAVRDRFSVVIFSPPSFSRPRIFIFLSLSLSPSVRPSSVFARVKTVPFSRSSLNFIRSVRRVAARADRADRLRRAVRRAKKQPVRFVSFCSFSLENRSQYRSQYIFEPVCSISAATNRGPPDVSIVPRSLEYDKLVAAPDKTTDIQRSHWKYRNPSGSCCSSRVRSYAHGRIAFRSVKRLVARDTGKLLLNTTCRTALILYGLFDQSK